MGRTGVHHTTHPLIIKGMIEAGLITGDTSIYFVHTSLSSLIDPLRIRQKRSRHRDHISHIISQYLLGHIRHIDPVGSHDRNVDSFFHPSCYIHKSRAGYRSDYGWNTCLVPTNTCIKHGDTTLFQRLSQLNHFFNRGTILDQIKHREPEHQDKMSANSRTNLSDDLNSKAHTIFVASTPLIITLVSTGIKHLIDEITFGTHNLNTIVTSTLGEFGTSDIVVNCLVNSFATQRLWLKAGNRCLNSTRGNIEWGITITACMKNLEQNFAIGLMNGSGYLFMKGYLPGRDKLGTKW